MRPFVVSAILALTVAALNVGAPARCSSGERPTASTAGARTHGESGAEARRTSAHTASDARAVAFTNTAAGRYFVADDGKGIQAAGRDDPRQPLGKPC